MLLVDPAPDHLLELREIIYPTVRRSPPPSLAAAQAAGYFLKRQEGLRLAKTLIGTEVIWDLLAMTPPLIACRRQDETRWKNSAPWS